MPNLYLILANIFISTLLASYSSKDDDIEGLSNFVFSETFGIGNRTGSFIEQDESYSELESKELRYKYDRVSFKARFQPFQKGFYKSKCFAVPNGKNEDWNEVCIFFNPYVNRGKGMVIVASEKILKESFRLGFDVSDDPKDPKVIKVVKAPEKGGFGAGAAHPLHRGDPVASERPIGLFPSDSWFWRSPPGQNIRRQAIDHLPIETRAAVARLHGTGTTEDQFISGVIESNMFSTNLLGDSTNYGALVLTGSRLNHACRPNVVYYLDERTQVLYMSAIESIGIDEELTISYRALDMLREARRESLKREYGFDCSCSHCQMSKELGKLSDYRIQRMHQLHSKAYDENESISLEEVEELLNLSEIEKIPWWIVTANSMAAKFFNFQKGDTIKGDITARVKKHVDLAKSLVILLAGPNWSQLDDLD